jgi:hypothetical protein
MTLGNGVDMDGTSDLAGERDRPKVGAELRRVRTSGGCHCRSWAVRCTAPNGLLFDFLVEIGVLIRQHWLGSPTGSGGSDYVRYRPWDRPCGQARAAPNVVSAGVTKHDRRVGLPRERYATGCSSLSAHTTGMPRSGQCAATWVPTSPGLLDARGLRLRLVLYEYIPVFGWGAEVASQV